MSFERVVVDNWVAAVIAAVDGAIDGFIDLFFLVAL